MKEQLSTSFAQQLIQVMNEAERHLRPIAEKALSGQRGSATAQMKVITSAAKFRDIRATLVTACPDVAIPELSSEFLEQIERVRQCRGDEETHKLLSFQRTYDLGRLLLIQQALSRLRSLNLLGLPQSVAVALEEAQLRWTLDLRAENVGQSNDEFVEVAGLDPGYATAVFDTQSSIYGRQIEAIATEHLGPNQPYLYVGPVDGHTRDWCLERVGKVYTRAEIEAMDNNQLPNPFLTGGGYNCRHSFLAAASEELTALLGTNVRAPGFEEDIAPALAQRAQAQHATRHEWRFEKGR